ncbi:MAG TPA: NAD-dependent epimerase/dehydratase family protein [Kofleriaceae bacterium]|nr:NAD-dependent epimerase/dehydratase family protein [Kofleriaceae bacterium]
MIDDGSDVSRTGLTRRDVLRHAAAGAAIAAGAGLVAQACSGPDTTASPPSREPAAARAPAPVPVKDAKKKILILGGTGFIGPAMVEAAQARGHTLTLFNRGKTNPQLFPDVEKLHGDRDGKLEALAGHTWDAVIDTSGYVPRLVKMSADLLARAVDQYVFISTISVYAGFAVPNMDESGAVATIADATNEDVKTNYGALKALSEKAAEASMPGRALVIRPGLIVGPRDATGRFTYWPVRVARGGEVLAPGGGSDPVQYIDVRDLAAWTIHMIEAKGAGTFNALGPASRLEMSAMLTGVKEAIPGSDARFTWVPADFLEKEKVQPWSEMPVWIPPTGEYAGTGTMSNARAVAQGLTFRPVGDTTKATLDWLKTLDEAERAKVTQGAGLPADREAKVLARWHARAKKTK